jgi:hypothetical protein
VNCLTFSGPARHYVDGKEFARAIYDAIEFPTEPRYCWQRLRLLSLYDVF